MAKATFLFFLVLSSLSARVNAQTGRFGNEWIHYDQTYYRVPITQRGLYRLTGSDLQRAGLPVQTIDPTTLQVFRRGVELAIRVTGERDKKLDDADWVEFLGEGNDGRQDTLLYWPMSALPHPHYSLYSDTAAYFLTWRTDGQTGKRITISVGNDAGNATPEPYHLAEQLMVLTQEMSTNPADGPAPIPTAYEVFFEEGEGWTGPMQQKDTIFSQPFVLDGWVRSAPVAPQVEMLLNGRDNTTHRVAIWAGKNRPNAPVLATAAFSLFNTARVFFSLPPQLVSTSNEITLSTRSQGPDATDRYSVSYYRLRYPQSFSLKGATQRIFNLLPNAQDRSYLELTDAPDSLLLYDITDPTAIQQFLPVRSDSTLQVIVPNTGNGRQLLATTQVRKPDRLERTVFRKYDPSGANYLLVSHERLMQPVGTVADPVRAYAAYRASAAGGRHDTLVVTMKQLMNQFSYGERTPLAIRRFADYMLTGGTDKYLFLIGRSNVYFPIRHNPNQYNLDLVTTIGHVPSSDVLLTAGLAGYGENVPAMPTGRLNTLSPQEVLNYLDKVKEYETVPANELWRKNVLHLTGGRSQYELGSFQAILDNVQNDVTGHYWGGNVTLRTKKTDEPVERIDISDVVNKGVSMLTFFGHSSPVVTDLDFGYASQATYNYHNKGRYPLMFFNGCGVGNIFYGATNSLSTDWVLTPDKGAIAVLAHCFSGYTGPLETFTQQLYGTLFADSAFYNQPIGRVHQEATRRVMALTSGAYAISNAHMMVLQGDPAVRIFPVTKADFVLDASANAQIAPRSDSVRLRVVVTNAGRYDERDSVELVVRKRLPDGTYHSYTPITHQAIARQDTLYYAFKPEAQPTTEPVHYELVVDPDNRVAELDETNNLLVFNVKDSTGLYTVVLPDSGQRLPPDRFNPLLNVTFDGVQIPDGAIVSASPRIQLVLLDDDTYRLRRDTVGIAILLKRPCANCQLERVNLSGSDVQWTAAGANNRFVLNYNPNNLPDGLYTLQVQAADVSGNRAGPVPYEIHFRVQNHDSLSGVQATPNPFANHTWFRFTITGNGSLGDGQISIRNGVGQVVRTLQQPVRVGENLFFWNGTDQGGAPLPSGLYLFQLELSNGRQKSGKVLLIK